METQYNLQPQLCKTKNSTNTKNDGLKNFEYSEKEDSVCIHAENIGWVKICCQQMGKDILSENILPANVQRWRKRRLLVHRLGLSNVSRSTVDAHRPYDHHGTSWLFRIHHYRHHHQKEGVSQTNKQIKNKKWRMIWFQWGLISRASQGGDKRENKQTAGLPTRMMMMMILGHTVHAVLLSP